MASAYTTLVSYAVMAFIIYFHSKKAFDVPYKIWQGVAVLLIADLTTYLQPFLKRLLSSDFLASVLLLIIGVGVIGILTRKNFFLKTEV